MRILVIVLALSFCGAIHAQPVCPMGDGWVFNSRLSDEFNGAGLDSAKWWDFNPSWHGRKPAYFSRENVGIKNGILELVTRVQKPEEVTVENKVRGYDRFTTALVKSKNRVTYGYFEARCRSMEANVCNAFWLYDPLDPPAKYREGGFSEEIDIFEIFGKPKKEAEQKIYHMTVHRYLTPYVESIANFKQTSLANKGAKHKVPFEFYDDFHVYGLLWTPTVLKWFVDGKEVFSRDNDFYNTALYVVFDCEIMEAWMGLPEQSDLPARFSIDYLRIWQMKGMPEP